MAPKNEEVVPSRIYTAACLATSAAFWWPGVMFSEMVLKRKSTNPLLDADGPEHMLGAPIRKTHLYYVDKPGHRGFLQSLLGARIGGLLNNMVNTFCVALPPLDKSSPNNVSTSEDTMLMRGVVRDLDTGEPVPGGIMDVWMGDPRSMMRYGDLDLDFDFRGKFRIDANGRYSYITLYPTTISIWGTSVVYLVNGLFLSLPGILVNLYAKLTGKLPGFRRPPHIHCYVSAPGYETLSTQVYFFDRMSEEDKASVLSEDVVRASFPLKESLFIHPKLSGSKEATKWVADFDFVLEKKGKKASTRLDKTG
mmetsp:Transcript_34306/g.84396  ORF Transcript_34306/g.84396 Transcript_34306/m.84396 type:complete len:308 (-) Transcript_34306:355-1278(-)